MIFTACSGRQAHFLLVQISWARTLNRVSSFLPKRRNRLRPRRRQRLAWTSCQIRMPELKKTPLALNITAYSQWKKKKAAMIARWLKMLRKKKSRGWTSRQAVCLAAVYLERLECLITLQASSRTRLRLNLYSLHMLITWTPGAVNRRTKIIVSIAMILTVSPLYWHLKDQLPNSQPWGGISRFTTRIIQPLILPQSHQVQDFSQCSTLHKGIHTHLRLHHLV